MSQKIDFIEYKKRLHEATKTIIPISEYIGWNKPIKYKCLVCDYEWESKEARSVVRGYGCPKCANKIRAEISKNLKTKSEKQFREELAIVQPNLIPNDKYINGHKKYHCICKIHNCDVYKTPDHMLHRKQGCDLCAIERNKCATRYTHDSYVKKLNQINPNIKLLSKYNSIKDRLNVKCLICDYEWNPIAESLISKMPCGCPSCAGNAIKTPEQFTNELNISHPYLTLLSDYVRSNIEVHAKCNKCGTDFWILPSKLHQGQQCLCTSESHGEFKVRIFLEKNNIEYERQMTFDDLFGISGFQKLSYDFYIPSQNILIEFQGEQHERPSKFSSNISDEEVYERFKKQKYHDERKREYAQNNNYELIEIWYWDISNVDKILSRKLLKTS